MPRPDHNTTTDEQLTAYALGELPPGSAESAAVEDRLSQDETARHEVESLRATADQLTAALASEPVPAAPHTSPSPHRWPMRLAVAGSFAAAAMIAVALLLPSLETARRSASATDPRKAVVAIEATPATETPEELHTLVYDIRDLLTETPQFTDAPEFDLAEALGDTNQPSAMPSQGATLFGDADGDATVETRWRKGLQRGEWLGTTSLNDNSTDFESVRPLKASDQAHFLRRASGENREEVRGLIVRARELQKEMRYDEATQLLDRALFVEPDNFTAGVLLDVIEDSAEAVDYKKLRREFDLTRARDQLTNLEAEVPYTDIILFPEDWPGLSEGVVPRVWFTKQELSPQLALNQLKTARLQLMASGLNENHSQIKKIDQQIVFFRRLGESDDRPNTEAYDRVEDNPFLAVLDNPLSTFSVDVDTASYANVRRFLTQQGQLPPADAVRIEEMVNYFDYGYAPPEVVRAEALAAGDEIPGAPFAAHVAVAAAPWSTSGGRLVRIGLKGVEVATDDRPAANLVFLLDVSGSMNNPQKLPLVKTGMKKLVEHLKVDDRIAIVVYAGASGLVLDSTTDHDAVLAAIDDLTPGGSTNGAAGIELAYQQAVDNYIPGGLNRVILCTDGDFNVGITDRGALTRLIEAKANLPEKPVTLTVLGFGSGNLKDATMEELSNRGDGNYGYVDSPREAEKLLAEQVNATLLTIAKDVKIQVEFNPAKVAAYRLIGYENRLLAKEDFNNDTVDAGDIGAGHTVTALYEIVPAGTEPLHDDESNAAVDDLKYQRPAALSDAADSGELLTLKLRYKEPNAPKEQGTSKLLEFPVKDEGLAFEDADEDFRFAASVAGFGMLLRGSPHAGDLDFTTVQAMAEASTAEWADRLGILTPDQQRRLEFIDLVKRAGALATPAAVPAEE